MRLMTNNPKKIVGLEGYGLEVVERIPIETEPNEINHRYLETKRDKLGHLILWENWLRWTEDHLRLSSGAFKDKEICLLFAIFS